MTYSKSLFRDVDDKHDAPVAVWESKDTKTGEKLMKQMENILKLPRTHNETFNPHDCKNTKKAQVWETEMIKSKEDLNLDIER